MTLKLAVSRSRPSVLYCANFGFITFGVAFHFLVAGNRRHFKFNMWVEHSKSQPTDDKPSAMGVATSRDPF